MLSGGQDLPQIDIRVGIDFGGYRLGTSRHTLQILAPDNFQRSRHAPIPPHGFPQGARRQLYSQHPVDPAAPGRQALEHRVAAADPLSSRGPRRSMSQMS